MHIYIHKNIYVKFYLNLYNPYIEDSLKSLQIVRLQKSVFWNIKFVLDPWIRVIDYCPL